MVLWESAMALNFRENITWFPREINTQSLSDLSLRSWPFAVLKYCMTPLSRAAPLIQVSFPFQLCIPVLCFWALHSSLEQLYGTFTTMPRCTTWLHLILAEKWLSVTKFHRLVSSEKTSLKENLSGHYADPLPQDKFDSTETNPDMCFSNLSSKRLVWRFHSFPWASNSLLQYFRLRKFFIISNWSLCCS